jgi:hypothetical protein
MTLEKYIQIMIEDGYWAKEDLQPIKCVDCESKDLEDFDYDYISHMVCEYSRRCKDCNKVLGHWAYGNWQL